MKLWRSIRDRLVADWRVVLKKWSTWLAAAWGALVVAVTAKASIYLGIMAFMPAGFWRYVAAAVLGFIAFGVPVLTANLKQKNLDG